MVGFENQYQVSSVGRIRSIINNHGTSKIKIRKTFIRSNTCNYYYVNLYVKNKLYTEAVHRAVAKAFIPNIEIKPMVNHIDGNKHNNCVNNLEWVTCSENHKHAFKLGLKSTETQKQYMIGTKRDSKSKYFNVSWDNSRQKWIGSIKENGKLLKSKRFSNEVDAALHVNWIIDKYNLDRPKNIIK